MIEITVVQTRGQKVVPERLIENGYSFKHIEQKKKYKV